MWRNYNIVELQIAILQCLQSHNYARPEVDDRRCGRTDGNSQKCSCIMRVDGRGEGGSDGDIEGGAAGLIMM